MSVFETAIGWLAPPLCVSCGEEGSSLCQNCSTSVILGYGDRCWQCSLSSKYFKTCPKCTAQGGPSNVWITAVYQGPVKELVRQYKFVHLRAAAEPIANLMVITLQGSVGPQVLNKLNLLSVPIPTATTRRRERSFGHAELLARKVSAKLKIENNQALARVGQQRQVGSARDTRLNLPKDNYYVRNPSKIRGRNILLVDDVVTTGGTIITATQVLRAVGAKQVYALAFAKRLHSKNT